MHVGFIVIETYINSQQIQARKLANHLPVLKSFLGAIDHTPFKVCANNVDFSLRYVGPSFPTRFDRRSSGSAIETFVSLDYFCASGSGSR